MDWLADGEIDALPRYQRGKETNQGGMGRIIEAFDCQLNRTVALKELKSASQNDYSLRRRFVVEARVTGQLEHPGIVPVYELVQPADDSTPYYTMRLVGKETLQTRIQAFHNRGRAGLGTPEESVLDLRQLVEAVVSVCNTLAYAHSRGVIHRDLKPQNVAVGPFGEVLVLDWGLAKVHRRRDPVGATGRPVETFSGRETTVGSVLGTPAYMAPEQARGASEEIDCRTDVYGVGAILHEVLTGSPPCSGDGPAPGQGIEPAMCSSRLLLPRMARPLRAICLKALANRREDRYETAEALRKQLKNWLDGEPVDVWPEPLPARLWRWVKRHKLPVAVVTTMLLVAGLALGYQERQEGIRRAAALVNAQNRNGQAAEKLGQVEAWRAEARTAPPRRARSLTAQAMAAAEQAVAVLSDGPTDPQLQDRARALLTDLQEEERDREMLARLAEAQLRGALGQQDDRSQRDAEYGSAFRWYCGTSVLEATRETIVRLVQSRPIRAELAAAFDHWSFARKEPKERDQLRQLAAAADNDPFRQQVRAAIRERKPGTLKQLASHNNLQALPALTLLFLAASLQQQAPMEATAVLREAQRRFPDDFLVNSELGLALLRAGPSEQAESVRFLTACVALRPESASAHNNLGNALQQTDRVELAIERYHQALQLNRNHVNALTNLGAAMNRKGQPNQAIEYHLKALKLQPNHTPAHVNLGLAFTAMKKFEDASKHLDKARRLEPEQPIIYDTLGRTLLDQGDLLAAVKNFRQAVALAPERANFRNNLGLVLQKVGALKEASEHLRKALVLEPNHPAANHNIGILLKKEGQLDDAIWHYRLALNGQPDNAKIHLDLGLALQAKGQLDKAIQHYRRAIELQPSLVDAHLDLSLLLATNGRFSESLLAFAAARKVLSPTDPRQTRITQSTDHVAHLRKLDARLPLILKNERQPSDDAERVGLAMLCQEHYKRLYVTSARLWGEILPKQPALAGNLNLGLRYKAACAAALAGAGQGPEAAGLDSKERDRWRKQALSWLRDDLTLLSKLLDKPDTPGRSLVQVTLRRWQTEPALAGLRDAATLGRWQAGERRTCCQFWAEVATLEERAASASNR